VPENPMLDKLKEISPKRQVSPRTSNKGKREQ
jgi:hypothetical protein